MSVWCLDCWLVDFLLFEVACFDLGADKVCVGFDGLLFVCVLICECSDLGLYCVCCMFNLWCYIV